MRKRNSYHHQLTIKRELGERMNQKKKKNRINLRKVNGIDNISSNPIHILFKFFGIYKNKIIMKSLRTDDIEGARPRIRHAPKMLVR